MVNFVTPLKRKSEVVTVRLNRDERDSLERLARKAKLSVSDLIRRWIGEAMEKRKETA